MKKFAIITKTINIKQGLGLFLTKYNSDKTVVWKFLGIPIFRETIEITDNANSKL